MPYVMAAPELIETLGTELATIGSAVNAAHLAAAAPTRAVLPAAADEVSTTIAYLFSGCGQGYQALAGQAVAFHEQFVQDLTASARSYADAEAVNTGSLRPVGAAAESIGSVVAALRGQLNRLFSDAAYQLLAIATNIYNVLANDPIGSTVLLAFFLPVVLLYLLALAVIIVVFHYPLVL
jgi:hypothetical protein